MILYRRTFPLKKGVSFSHYLEVLDHMNFSPYTLVIERIARTKEAYLETILTDYGSLGWTNGGFVIGGVLFSKATIKYLGKGDFILEASIGTGNLLMLSFYALFSVFSLLVIFFITLTRNLPLENMFIVLFILFIILYPFISKYFNEIKFLDRIGSLGSDIKADIKKKNKVKKIVKTIKN